MHLHTHALKCLSGKKAFVIVGGGQKPIKYIASKKAAPDLQRGEKNPEAFVYCPPEPRRPLEEKEDWTEACERGRQ